MENSLPGPELDNLLDHATTLLNSLEKQLKAITVRHQLAHPDYAAQRGLSVIHFNNETGPNRGPWMLLTSDGGTSAKSITEWDKDSVPSTKKEWIKEFCGGAMPEIVAYKRTKTTLEQQRRVVRDDGGLAVLNPRMKRIWFIIISLAILALITFLGVGIIATTATFSEGFVKYFFWISIVWTLASSTLLVSVVRAFGANGKDALSAFLAAVAIWLVVIQIGQTKLNGQLDQAKNGSSIPG